MVLDLGSRTSPSGSGPNYGLMLRVLGWQGRGAVERTPNPILFDEFMYLGGQHVASP